MQKNKPNTILIIILCTVFFLSTNFMIVFGSKDLSLEELTCHIVGDIEIQTPNGWLHVEEDTDEYDYESHYFYGSGVKGDASEGYAFCQFLKFDSQEYTSKEMLNAFWDGMTNSDMLLEDLLDIKFNEDNAKYYNFSLDLDNDENMTGIGLIFFSEDGLVSLLMSDMDDNYNAQAMLRLFLLEIDDLELAIEKAERVTQTWRRSMMKVGTDIPAGTYLMVDNGTFYFEVTSDSTGSFESIIANGNPENREYIKLQDGQYIKTTATFYNVGDGPELPQSGNLPPGTYLVGLDIEPGEYVIETTRDWYGYVAVLNQVTHKGIDGILMNDNFQGTRYITVYDGQYLQLSGCELFR